MIDDIFECFPIQIDDQLLSKAKVAAWMFNQQLETPEGKKKPFAPKSFPERAIDLLIQLDGSKDDFLEIYLDPKEMAWNSKIIKDGKFGKLSPEQLDAFFQTQFYRRMEEAVAKEEKMSVLLFLKKSLRSLMSLRQNLKKLTKQRRSQNLQTKIHLEMENVTILELVERFRHLVTWV